MSSNGDHMLRVAILSPSAELGGAERSLLGFLKVAHDRLVEATVVMPREGPLGQELMQLGVPWQVVPQPKGISRLSRGVRSGGLVSMLRLVHQGPGHLLRLAGAIRRISPDVIYTNGIKAHLLAAALRPFLRISTVWHVRDHWGGRLVGRIADSGSDLIIANSRSTAARIREFMRRPGKVEVIYNAIDTDKFAPDGRVADVGTTRNGAPRVGLAAAFARLKGHELLLCAMEQLRPRFPSLKCYFIGGTIYDTVKDRGYEEELRQSVSRKELDRCVTFTGFQTEMAPWYRAMDIVVNASVRPEGFGRTLLEAMACGRAVIGPDTGGVPEFVRHGGTGLLYRMGNCEALADAMARLLENAELRQSLGRAGRQTAVRRFAIELHARTVAQALRRAARMPSRL